MALATRCPKCGTAFRVVRDQIKLREGWVRCGVCSTPFDSHASLIEIDMPAAAAPAEPPVAAQAPVAEPHSAQPAPPAPDPIEDHPAVLRTRVPRPAGPADGNAPAPPAPPAPGFPGAGIELPRDDEARFGPVPDLYPALDAARRAGLGVQPRSAAPAFVPASPVSVPGPAAPLARSAPPAPVSSPAPVAPVPPAPPAAPVPPRAPAAPVSPPPPAAPSPAAPAPFVPTPTFRADTEAASAAHLRAALGQGGAAASGRTEPSVWAGESGASAHTGLRGSEPSLRANEPTFDPQIASLRANEPLFEPRTTSPRAGDPVSRQVEPTFGPIVSPTADAAASSSPAMPVEPRLRATEPTFSMPPLPRDDREPHFVVNDTADDTADDDADDTTPALAPEAASPSSPGFMATADDDEPSRWRWVWLVLAVLAVVALLGQSIWIYRTELATWFPSMRPALEKACVQLDCTVGYPRDPRQLTIESSALETWAPEAANAGAAAGTSDTSTIGPSATSSATPGVRHLALRVTLRNRAKHPQAWPALELSLTDFSDTVVARRVLLPSTYLPPQQLADPIPAGQERSLRIPIDTTEARASGYRVAAFFP
ncbi:hypothetical protein GCM10007242_37580 [Pigmentiphaga litoralis]|uniref:zinc-ribbon and DUF3426 domain-containing protein n=1 Tax=Pigmentiphaga litoralis TaxID=516702 RepID=UPI001671B120|nr:zinc-ribbon and DUF3426 domain-containing protein [Pigmentiphaga litoralis]GGX27790.1 hypothetical protein GCM10007242_37580 [Pigmentiphaga litoralis]